VARPRRPRTGAPDRRAAGRPTLTVGQAARVVGVSPSTLRLWEHAGLVQTVRNPGGYRLYTPESLAILERVKYLRDVRQLNVPAIREALGVRDPRDPGRYALASLGRKLREVRRRRGLRLADVARDAGISTGFLSAVERSQAAASVATMQRLTAAYRTSVLELFDLPGGSGRRLRPADRQVLQAHPGVTMELLAPASSRLESMLFRAAPRSGSTGAYVHDGEELIYVLSGAIEVSLDEREHVVLRAGDSFWFESTRGHRWLNPSATEEAALVWVCSRGFRPVPPPVPVAHEDDAERPRGRRAGR
jgi:DNA-binding transcriptional MerR regulator/quercetin dioxygenase-like cupin family protein